MDARETLRNGFFPDEETVRGLVAEEASFPCPIGGENEWGERTLTEICQDGVRITTFQENGWTRLDEYLLDEDGFCQSQGFEGRWA